MGTLLFFRGERAVVRFRDGTTVALPAAVFVALGLERGAVFTLVTLRNGGKVVDVRVEAMRPAGQKPARLVTPMVKVRRGKAVITRR